MEALKNEDDRWLDPALPERIQQSLLGLAAQLDQKAVTLASAKAKPLLDEVTSKLSALEVITRSMPEVVDRQITKRSDELQPKLTIVHPEQPEVALEGRQHFMFETALRMFSCRTMDDNPISLGLVGPSGTFKSTMALNLARAFSQEAFVQPFSPYTSESALLGYANANGIFIESPTSQAFDKNAIVILEEFDNANPQVVVALNTAIANREYHVNGRKVEAGKDSKIILCMNTWGRGGNQKFTRGKLDNSSLDRFPMLEIPYDWGLVADIVGVQPAEQEYPELHGPQYSSEQGIYDYIVALNQAVANVELDYDFTPRAIFNGIAFHRAGISKRLIDESCIWKGMSEEHQDKIKDALPAKLKRMNAEAL